MFGEESLLGSLGSDNINTNQNILRWPTGIKSSLTRSTGKALVSNASGTRMNKSDGTGTLGLEDLLRLRGRGSRGRGRVYRSLLLVVLFETAESLGLCVWLFFANEDTMKIN